MANTYVRYAASGAVSNFSVTFPYLEKTHVGVTVDGVAVSHTWANPTTITISPAPASGTMVELRRSTPSNEPIVDFQDGALVTEEQLDTNARQSLYVSQEASDVAADTMTYVDQEIGAHIDGTAPTDDQVRAVYDAYNIAAWGDSLTQGNFDWQQMRTPWTNLMPNYLGRFVHIYNGGYGGQHSGQIKARFDANPDKKTWLTIIWSGRNDKSELGGWNATGVQNIRSMVEACEAAGNTNIIVCSVTNNGGEYAGAGGAAAANYAEIISFNNMLAAAFPSYYYDLRAALVAQGPELAGLTPTANDLSDRANDMVPRSIRVDQTNVHYVTAGNIAIAKLLAVRVKALWDTQVKRRMTSNGASNAFGNSALAAPLVTARTSFNLGDGDGENSTGKFLSANQPYRNTYVGHMTGEGASWNSVGGRDITAVGYGAGGRDPSGGEGTYVGALAGAAITSGSFNVFLGSSAGEALTTGTGNVAVGHSALATAVSVSEHTAIGRYAMNLTTSPARPSVVVGFQAMYSNTVGDATALGYKALQANTTGIGNVAVGEYAMTANTTGSGNVGIGKNAMLAHTTGGGNVGIGLAALAGLTTGSFNIGLGNSAGKTITDAEGLIAIGHQALYASTVGANTAVGYQAMQTATTGTGTAVGYQVLQALTTGASNVGMGRSALKALTTGSNNVAIGANAAQAMTVSPENVAIGTSALTAATDTSGGSVAVGYRALFASTSGVFNTAVGRGALIAATTGVRNTALGYGAGAGITTAGKNVVVGYNAGDNVSTGENNIVIGYDIDAPSATANGQLNIGAYIFGTGMTATGTSVSSAKVGFGVTAPETPLHLAGAMTVNAAAAPGSPATSGAWVLYVDIGDGNKLKAKASTGTVVTLGTP